MTVKRKESTLVHCEERMSNKESELERLYNLCGQREPTNL